MSTQMVLSRSPVIAERTLMRLEVAVEGGDVAREHELSVWPGEVFAAEGTRH